jgi:NarL family two-component system sensor histidine kinase LiaS
MHMEVRKKMAQDMHDGLAQQLFFLSAQLYRIKQGISQVITEQMAAAIEQMEEQVKKCHLEVRGYIHYLRDDREASHLFDAVRQLLERITAGSGIEIQYTTRGRVVEESLAIEEAIYRFVEEATYNVMKHASATRVEVNLEVTAVQWTIRLRDNGVGFSPELCKQKAGSFGLVGMNERIQRVGGTVTIRSHPKAGTEVAAIIPREGGKLHVESKIATSR